MRERIPNTTLVRFALGLSVTLFMSACSSNNELNSGSNKKHLSNKVIPSSTKVNAKELEHTHTSNPCTEALAHSHPFTEKNHKHSYDCESTNEIISNAHIHPPTEKYKRYRHVHPNGANKHSHHRE